MIMGMAIIICWPVLRLFSCSGLPYKLGVVSREHVQCALISFCWIGILVQWRTVLLLTVKSEECFLLLPRVGANPKMEQKASPYSCKYSTREGAMKWTHSIKTQLLCDNGRDGNFNICLQNVWPGNLKRAVNMNKKWKRRVCMDGNIMLINCILAGNHTIR